MTRIKPERTERQGRHVNEYWPRLFRRVWSFKHFRLVETRRYAAVDYQEQTEVNWVASIKVGSHQLGIKYQKDTE